ncbi:hypothetical protein ME795_03220 [Lactobacillus delbrueckii]|nr:hypothetical protein ME795_03220 [Lactobacillus delbrueckii]
MVQWRAWLQHQVLFPLEGKQIIFTNLSSVFDFEPAAFLVPVKIMLKKDFCLEKEAEGADFLYN